MASHLRAITYTKAKMTIVKSDQVLTAQAGLAASMKAVSITIKRANA
jgi:hypothetical protein